MGKYPDYMQQSVPWNNIKSILYSVRRNATPAEPAPDAVVQIVKVCKVYEKWTFVPCGHYPFCGRCSGIISGERLPCPICRHADVLPMRIYDD